MKRAPAALLLLLLTHAALADETIANLAACYQGLRPSLGVNRMHFGGKNGVPFASGRRGASSTLGIYTFEDGKVAFHALPRGADSVERVNGGTAENYYVRLRAGAGKDARDVDLVLRNTAHRRMTWLGEGTFHRFLGGKAGTPVHAAPPARDEIRNDDDGAIGAFTESFTELLRDRDTFLDGTGRAEAVAACQRSFPRGTPVGDAVLRANRRFAAAGPGAARDALVSGPGGPRSSRPDEHGI